MRKNVLLIIVAIIMAVMSCQKFEPMEFDDQERYSGQKLKALILLESQEIPANIAIICHDKSVGPHPIISREWNFGAGTTDTGKMVSHKYGEPGNYNIQLVV